MCIAKSSNKTLQIILNSYALLRHKCINTGEVYYTDIIFDSNIYYYFGKCAITGWMCCIMFLSQTCITTLYGCNILE